ncbi:MAG: ATP-binding protein [Acetobacteraceae bacterium]
MKLTKAPISDMTVPAEDVIELVDAALAADYTRVRRVSTKIARGLTSGDVQAAERLRSLIRRRGVPLRASGYAEALPIDMKSRLPLIEEQAWPTVPVFLNGPNQAIVKDFLADAQHVDLLSSKGIATRLCMLIAGPPGTGKSLLAGHLAAQLGRPLYTVRLDAVISSLLGDTAKNIRSLFDFVPTKDGVLFLDEMDAIAKLRDDRQELGELKRVVNTVIQGLDSLDDRAVVIAATNHPQLLDTAIWRRFPYKIELSQPDESVRIDLWRYFLFEDDVASPFPPLLASASEGLSGADIQTIALSARRQAVLEGHPIDTGAVAWAAYEASVGRPTPPPREHLTSDQKRMLALGLVREKKVSQSDVARLINVTRQAVSGYLKEGGDGGG